MARRTKEEALATRERILDAAERVFHRKGVSRASLEDIATAAHVTRGAIYWHFRDKAELFHAMMARVALPAEELLARADRGDGADPLELLRRAAVDILVRTAKDERMRRVSEISYHKCEYVGDGRELRERQLASHRECQRVIERSFRACVKAGLLPRTVAPRVAAIGIQALVAGLVSQWLLDPEAFALARHGAVLVDAYLNGLKG